MRHFISIITALLVSLTLQAQTSQKSPHFKVDITVCATATFIIILLIRFLSIRYHLSLPHLHSVDGDASEDEE